jgi:hypothetical protein
MLVSSRYRKTLSGVLESIFDKHVPLLLDGRVLADKPVPRHLVKKIIKISKIFCYATSYIQDACELAISKYPVWGSENHLR